MKNGGKNLLIRSIYEKKSPYKARKQRNQQNSLKKITIFLGDIQFRVVINMNVTTSIVS